jgi:putative colanic acid biosynthesis glycosyltransferase
MKGQSPLLSIITVVRDDPAGFAATAASIAAQSWSGYEWLVADGGSGPATLNEVRAAGRSPDWFDTRPDGGPFAGMDRAKRRARGRYLLFLNAGDHFADANVLRDLLYVLTIGEADIFYGDAMEDPGDGKVRRKPARHWRWAFYGMPAHHCALFYRREMAEDLWLDDGHRIAGDYAFTLQAISRSSRIVKYPRVISCFAPGGLSRRDAALGRLEQFEIRRNFLKMPAFANVGIRLIQIVAHCLRRIYPWGYALWRFQSINGK